MEGFTGKKSWDGFIYEHIPLAVYKPKAEIRPIPIEVKSLKIHPRKEKFVSLNELLDKKLPTFSKHFQKEATIAVVTVFPYNNGTEKGSLPFDLRAATTAINKHVANNVVACLLFVDITTRDDNYTSLGVQCAFVSKNPNFNKSSDTSIAKLFNSRLGGFKK